MSWANALLLGKIGICILVSLPSVVVAEDNEDNYKVIIGVGVGGLVLLILLWILLCFCLECMCFSNRSKKGRTNGVAQKEYAGGYDGPASGVDPWTVEQEQAQPRQQYSQYQSQQPPPPRSNYSRQPQPVYASAPPYSGYGAPYTNVSGVPIPKPDYYYDEDVTKPVDPVSSMTSPTTPNAPSGTSYKPVPPPKPKKYIPPPDYA